MQFFFIYIFKQSSWDNKDQDVRVDDDVRVLDLQSTNGFWNILEFISFLPITINEYNFNNFLSHLRVFLQNSSIIMK